MVVCLHEILANKLTPKLQMQSYYVKNGIKKIFVKR